MIFQSAVRSSRVVGPVLLLLASSRAFAAPEAKCISSATRPEIRVCSQLEDEMKAGRVTRWRIWVEGTRERIDVRVRTSTPRTVRLDGGNDQVVRTGGGNQNEIRIKVTTLEPGPARFEYHLHFEDIRREAAEIAAQIAPHLATVQAAFAYQRRLLSGPPYSPGAVKDLLDKTEAALNQVLGYPELAAMRDSVAAELRQARADLSRRQSRLPGQEIALAAFQQPDSPDSVLDRITNLLAKLTEISAGKDLLVDLCVVSQPRNGATVKLHPQSYPEGVKDRKTNGMLTLYRGRYVYKATLRGQRAIECVPTPAQSALDRCTPLDLLLNAETIFDCNFGQQSCALRSGSAAACR